MKRIKDLERELADKNSVVRHLRTELDRMHGKYGAEIKKLQKQLELKGQSHTQAHTRKSSSGNVMAMLNNSISKKSTMSMMAKEPIYGRAAMTPSAKGVLKSERKPGHAIYGTEEAQDGDDDDDEFFTTADQNTNIIAQFNAGLSSIQSGRAAVRSVKAPAPLDGSVKSARLSSASRGVGAALESEKAKPAKKGGIFGWFSKGGS